MKAPGYNKREELIQTLISKKVISLVEASSKVAHLFMMMLKEKTSTLISIAPILLNVIAMGLTDGLLEKVKRTMRENWMSKKLEMKRRR